jgi:hypothetical protein
MSRVHELYRGLVWLGLVSSLVLPTIVLTQPARYDDGLLLSVALVAVLFLTSAGVAWLSVQLRRPRRAEVGETVIIRTAVRGGLLAGGGAVSLLILQLLRVITPIDAALIGVFVIVFDLYLASRKAAW